MEQTVLDPLLASKEQAGSMGWGPGGAAHRRPAQAALCDPGRCWEDPGNSASSGARPARGESTPGPSVGALM